MNQLDGITAVLAIPVVEENGTVREARPGDAALDTYMQALEDAFAALCARDGNQLSELDKIWSELLGEPVHVAGADLGIYEKKGLVYPAILFLPSAITGQDGGSLADAITACCREADRKTRLAELIGTRLGVDWVRIFTTFGGTGQ
jgi:hypothetical protein